MSRIATALAAADKADPELAAAVVRTALERSSVGIARSVLLFLTADFAHMAHAAVVAGMVGCGSHVGGGRGVPAVFRRGRLCPRQAAQAQPAGQPGQAHAAGL